MANELLKRGTISSFFPSTHRVCTLLTYGRTSQATDALLHAGEWQQLTGLDKMTQEKERAARRSVIHRGPLDKAFVLHPSLECFTLFRMRTNAALNEEHRWPLRGARNPVSLTCNLLQLLAALPFAETHGLGESGYGHGELCGGGDRESADQTFSYSNEKFDTF